MPEGSYWDFAFSGWGKFIRIKEMAMNAEELDTHQAYMIADASGRNYSVYDTSKRKLVNVGYTHALDENSNGTCWTVIKEGKDSYLYNIGADKFGVISEDGSLTLSDTPVNMDIHNTDNGISINGNSRMFVLNNNVSFDEANIGIYTLNVSSVGYATAYLYYNAEIPENVEAYIATEVVDNRVKLKKVEGILPANSGVIIKAAEGNYTFNKSYETPITIENNILKGTIEKTEITAESNFSYFVLSAPGGAIGMYLAQLKENKFWNNACKVYLPISNGDLGIFDDEVDSSVEQLSRRLVFDFGDETGIDEVKTENANVKTAVYDLSGRHIQNAQKGIYIQNGKLMVK